MTKPALAIVADVSADTSTIEQCLVCGQPTLRQNEDGAVDCIECVREWPSASAHRDAAHPFESPSEGRYRFTVPRLGLTFELDYIRREESQLKGELLVRCTLAGARTSNADVLSVSDLNLSSARTRQSHAKYLAERSRAKDVDFDGLLEEFAQRVLVAERQGAPAVLLHELPRPTPDETFEVDGFPLLARHPMILFGDGGTAKSYLALYLAGRLADRKKRVGLFDWELAGEDHRDRLERLFGPAMPTIHYARCSRPLYYEADRIRRVVRDNRLDYLILDSVAFACDGAPEAAEVAGRYFQAVRSFGPIGSLHVAHVNKSEDADRKPFGSAFWFNGCRALWNVKVAERAPGDSTLAIALHDRKQNLGGKRPSVGFEFRFEGDQTEVRRVDPARNPELAVGLQIGQRIQELLRAGAMTKDQIAAELEDVKPDTIRRTLNLAVKAGKLLRMPGPESRYGLPQRGES